MSAKGIQLLNCTVEIDNWQDWYKKTDNSLLIFSMDEGRSNGTLKALYLNGFMWYSLKHLKG
jgi:hypothetical protein